MVDANSPKPLYEQIKDYILTNIHTGKFPPNTRIPSERSLSKKFGVSRLTVNKAIKELEKQGWLSIQIGKGTFINEAQIDQELETLTSFSEDMIKRGRHPASRVITAEMIPAPPEIAKSLGILPGADIIKLQRVRLSDHEPIALETSHLIEAYVPNILYRHDFSQESLYAVLRDQYNLHLIRAEQTFEARLPSPLERSLLNLTEETAILGISRVTYAQNDRPIELVQSAYRGDLYKFRAVLRRI